MVKTKAAYSIWFSVALLLLVACAPSERLARGPDPSSVFRPGDYDMSLEVDGAVRTWILHVPPAASAGEPLPLLIVLHGGGGTGRKMQRALGFDRYADARGFYVAYPDASHLTLVMARTGTMGVGRQGWFSAGWTMWLSSKQ